MMAHCPKCGWSKRTGQSDPRRIRVACPAGGRCPLVLRNQGLGDLLARILTWFGITKARVSKAQGGECGCSKRQAKLNALAPFPESCDVPHR